MLKFTYTETGICLERLEQTLLEELITQRVMLALRVRSTLIVEPGTASFLLPSDLPEWTLLKHWCDRDRSEISFCVCDAETIEVSLRGIWLASSRQESVEGIFLADLDEWTEHLMLKTWNACFSRQSFLIRF
jgi:hypothetical protein